MKKAIWLWIYLFFVSSPFFFLYFLARIFRLIIIRGRDLNKFFPGKNGIVTISNHVTFVETLVIPLLMYPFFFFWLSLFIRTIAKKKWLGRWWLALLRPATILVFPGEGIGTEKSMKRAVSFLKEGERILHVYPSGMRLKRTKKEGKETKRLGEREIGKFYPGVLVAILANKSDLLPIYFEVGKWRPLPIIPTLIVIIGERIPFNSLGFPDKKFAELTRKEIEDLLGKLEDILLKT